MAFTLVSTQTIIARNAGALYGVEVGNANMNSYAAAAGSSIDAFLNTVYANSVGTASTASVAAVLVGNLGITGDAATAATNYIIGQLNAVAVSARGAVVNSMLTAFANMTGDPTFGSFAAAWNVRVSNAVSYATVSGNGDSAWAGVTSTPAGQTFALTTGSDALTGTDGNDLVIAQLGALTTLQSSDHIEGNGGTDTLRVVTDAAAQSVAGFALTSVERIEVQSSAVGGSTLGLAGADASLATAASVSSTSDVTLNNLAKLVGAEISNTTGTSLTLGYNAAVVAGATTQNLAVNAASATFNAAGVETVNVTATGANTLTFGTAPAAVNVAGAGTLDLGTLTATTTTVNAAQNTGGVTAALGATATATVTGGAGADHLNVAAVTGNVSVSAGAGNDVIDAHTNLTATDVIDGGDGVDTLIVANSSQALDKVTNVETLQASGALTITLGAAAQAAGVNAVKADGANALSVSTAAAFTNALAVTLGTGADAITNTGNVALTVYAKESDVTAADALAGGTGQDTLVVTADAGNLNLSGVSGFEVVRVLPNATTAAEDASIVLGNNTVASGKVLTIDASALVDTGATLTVDASANQPDEGVSVIGGAGADTIIGGVGNDVISTGAGNDSITAGTGNDNVAAGAGDDVIVFAGNLTAADTVDGGDGIDTLVVTSVTSAALANVSNVENLAFSTSATLSSNLSFTNFDLSAVAGGQTLTLGAGYTNATTVKLGVSDVVINTANAPLTVNTTAAILNGATATVTGGTGVDILNVTGGGTVALTSVTGVDRINLKDVGDAATGADAAGSDYTVNLGSYATSVTVDASELDAGTITNGTPDANFENAVIDGSSLISTVKLTAIGGAGYDTITGGAGNDTLSGGAGNDTIATGNGNNVVDGGDGNDTITAGTGNDLLAGGAGNDTFVLAANLTGEDTIDGGSGTNTMQYNGGTSNLDFLNVYNIQTLTLQTATTTTLGTNAAAAGINTINGNSGNDVINASVLTGGVTFVSGTGNDNLTSGAGNDTFVFSGSQLDANDTIVAGAGSDTIRLDNASTAGVGAAVTAVLSAVSGVESIVVNDLSLATDTAGDVSITLNAAFTAVNNVTLIDGSALDLGETLTVDASANVADDTSTTTVNEAEAVSILGGAGADTLIGGAANDTIVGGSGSDSITGNAGNDVLSGEDGRDFLSGGAGNDVLDGGAGNDVLVGGAGQDTLTGGAGADIFVFEAVADSTGSTADVVTDFTSGTDRVFIKTSAITGGTSVTWKGNAASFEAAQSLLVVGEAGAVYNTATHTLWVDANKDGTLNANDIQIVLSNVATLAATDVTSGATSPTVITSSTWNGTVAHYNAATTLETDDTVTIIDTAANINANLSALLADAKVDAINAGTPTGSAGSVTEASNDTTPIVLTQAQALVPANMAKLGGDANDVITVSDVLIDTQAEFNAIAALAAVDNIDLTAAGTLTLDQASALAANASKLSTNGTVTVSDVAIDTAGEVAALGAKAYVDVIDITSAGAVTLSMAQYTLNGGGAKIATNGTVTIADSTMSAANIGTYNGYSNVDAIDFTGGTVTLTQQQAIDATKLGTAGTVNVIDSAVDTQAEYNALQALARVDTISINGDTLTLDVPSALAATKLQTSGTVTVTGSSTDVLANWTALSSVSGVGPSIDGFDLTDNAITLTEAQYTAFSAGSKTFAANDVVTISGQVGASTLDASQAVINLQYTSGSQASVVTFDQNGADTTLLDSGDRFNVTNADVISGFGAGDKIDLTAFQLSGSAQVTDFTTDFTVLRDNSYYVAYGTYSSGVFTYGGGSDSLVLFDANTGAGNTAINMVGVVVLGTSVTSADLVLV